MKTLVAALCVPTLLAWGASSNAQSSGLSSQEVHLVAQGLEARLPAPAGASWRSSLTIVDGRGATHLELTGGSGSLAASLVLRPVDTCPDMSGATKAGTFSYLVEPSGDFAACGSLYPGKRSVNFELRGSFSSSSGLPVDALLTAITEAVELGPVRGQTLSSPQRDKLGRLRLGLFGGKTIPDSGQSWSEESRFSSSARYEQLAPTVGNTTLSVAVERGKSCQQALSGKMGKRLHLPFDAPGLYSQALANAGTLALCREVDGGLLILSLSSPFDPDRALEHAAPFLEAVASSWGEPRKGATSGPGTSAGDGRRDRISAMIDSRRVEEEKKRAEHEKAQKRLREMRKREREAAKPKKQRSTTHWESRDFAVFGEVGWRFFMNDSSRVPKLVVQDGQSDPRSVLERIGSAYSLRAGAVAGLGYGALSFDSYGPGARDGTSPAAFQLELGFGQAGRFWDEGGNSEIKSVRRVYKNKYGETWIPDENETEEQARYRRAMGFTRARGRSESWTMQRDAGWIQVVGGFYGGWRYIQDFVGGEDPDQGAPLVSGSGPLGGVAFFFRNEFLAGEVSQESFYYLHGWDDHGRLGIAGRASFGTPWLLMDLRYRLDPGTGREFTVGIRGRFGI